MSQLADLIQRYYDAFNARDFAAYERMFTADCLIEAPGVELRGIEGARAFDKVWQTAMPDTKIVSLNKATGGHIVMCENRLRGTHTGPFVTVDGTLPASGVAFDERYMATLELSGERIKRQSLHFDRLQVMKLLGRDTGAANIAAVQRAYAAFGTGDLPGLLAAVDDDVTWGIESIAAPQVAPYGVGRGKKAVARFFEAWGTSADFQSFEPTDFHTVGDQVFNTLRYEATVKSTGKKVANASAQVWTFKHGKIISWRGYEDTAATRDAFTK